MRVRILAAIVTGLVLSSLAAVPTDRAPAAAAPTAAQAAPKRPNILVIFADDMRREEMRYLFRTRRLIGKPGVTYSRGLSENPLCCPFRAVLLTGQYTHNNGVLSNKGRNGGFAALDRNRTLNVTLKRRGYNTAWIGKYLNGYPTSRRLRAKKYVPPGWTEWHAPVANIYDYRRVTLNRNGRLHRYTKHRADLMGQVGSAVIKRLAQRRKPFFAAVSFLAPHVGTSPGAGWVPPVPAPRHRGSLRGRMGPMPTSFNERNVSDKPRFIRRLPRLSTKRRQKMVYSRRVRAESLKSVDQAIARQLRALRSTGELRNTIVAFTSDNGILLGEHRLTNQKQVPYEESVRVPMMMRGPGFPSGRTDRALVGAVDLASTVARAARVVGALPHPVDGRDLRPKQGRSILLETGTYLLGNKKTGARRAYVGVRSGKFMYAKYWNGDEELYNLARDPHQLRSLHADPGYAGTLRNLRADTDRLKDCAGAECRR